MSIPSKEEKAAAVELIDKCRIYLNDNFHKFTETNKIKISLALITKAMPTKIEGGVTVQMGTATIDNKPLEVDIGDDNPAGDASNTQ